MGRRHGCVFSVLSRTANNIEKCRYKHDIQCGVVSYCLNTHHQILPVANSQSLELTLSPLPSIIKKLLTISVFSGPNFDSEGGYRVTPFVKQIMRSRINLLQRVLLFLQLNCKKVLPIDKCLQNIKNRQTAARYFLRSSQRETRSLEKEDGILIL